ncbi:MAG: diacylglycerol kinase, partial [Cyclobacteriaceae bacterium]
KHPQAGLVKDLAAGAVLVIAIVAAFVGAFIFIPKYIAL